MLVEEAALAVDVVVLQVEQRDLGWLSGRSCLVAVRLDQVVLDHPVALAVELERVVLERGEAVLPHLERLLSSGLKPCVSA
jgi:hypothetical protein